MKTSTIAEAKNNLSHLIHQLETEESIQLTRYGKPVAVMMSEAYYKKLISPEISLNSTILDWRNQLDEPQDSGFNEDELKSIRTKSVAREFSWDNLTTTS